MPIFVLLSGRGPHEEVLKRMKDDLFRVLLVVWNIFSNSLGASRNLLYQNCIKFIHQGQQGGVFKVMKSDHFFSHFGDFSEVFGQVKRQLLLELHDITRVPQEVACRIGFNICFVITVSREECSNLQKMTIFRYF